MRTASAPKDCPVLVTERLTLRAHTVRDFADSAAMWADPVVVKHIGGVPFSPEDVWSRILRYAGLWPLLGFGYWTIRESDSGRFVGEAGFADFRRQMVPDLASAPECGWALAGWAHGMGYASEALRTILDWGDRSLEGNGTVSLIEPANEASIRLARKLGYREFARANYRNRPCILLERRAR